MIHAAYWPWIKVGGFALICFAVYTWGGSNATARCERAALARENKALTQAVADRDAAIKARNAAQVEADKLAALPPKVVTVVRGNPSRCSLPRPVSDAIRVQVDATNDAIRTAPGSVP